MKYCIYCGEKLNDDAEYCTKCGKTCQKTTCTCENKNQQQNKGSTGLGLSIASICVFWFPLLSFIFGGVGLYHGIKSKRTSSIVCSIIGICLALCAVVCWAFWWTYVGVALVAAIIKAIEESVHNGGGQTMLMMISHLL